MKPVHQDEDSAFFTAPALGGNEHLKLTILEGEIFVLELLLITHLWENLEGRYSPQWPSSW